MVYFQFEIKCVIFHNQKYMKKIIVSIIILIFFNFNSALVMLSIMQNYNYLEYELFRNNKSIGYHKYDFDKGWKKLINKLVK